MIDGIIYNIEELHGDVEEIICRDREYFLERRIELIELLEELIRRIEDE
jgi:hypothetical protein